MGHTYHTPIRVDQWNLDPRYQDDVNENFGDGDVDVDVDIAIHVDEGDAAYGDSDDTWWGRQAGG